MKTIQEQLFRAVDRMPAFPKSVQRVLALTADSECSPKDLVEVIKHDPIFTLKILKVVNSPYIGLVQKITSIHQATVYLGLNTLKNIALNLATIGTLPRDNKAGFDMNEFWAHSLATASVSQRVGALYPGLAAEPEDLFSTGLLHDVGKVVFALYMPEDYKRALALTQEGVMSLHAAEQQIFGATHADIGALLAEKWDLPETLVKGIALHHTPYDAEFLPLDDCVFAANQVCKMLAFGFAGEYEVEQLPVAMSERMAMDLEGLVAAIPDLDNELSKASVFINA